MRFYRLDNDIQSSQIDVQVRVAGMRCYMKRTFCHVYDFHKLGLFGHATLTVVILVLSESFVVGRPC